MTARKKKATKKATTKKKAAATAWDGKGDLPACRKFCQYHAKQKGMTEEKLLALVEKNYPDKTSKLSEVRLALTS